ncbi:hypothetical protein [Sphingomonas sp.]|jgi:hypothetical protein|uniref:hypothetical protein n=1 Tax=Sphingomonas sp. TaxID=28214 RepID=UPI0017D27834|nr:hypothetical protein [Sphingomonas sp.]MBA3511548.1 hypothetical protein [Sphingomonas sp.]
MFIRFVIASRDEDSGRRQGLFQAADELRASGRMSGSHEQRLNEVERWFRENLPVPKRFAVSSKPRRKAQAITWFRHTATEQIARMRDFQTILESYGVGVEMLREKRPGYVVYEDEHQVVAYPFSETRC